MRIVLILLLLIAGWLFMMENDQEHVTIVVPGSGQVGPFSVGVIVLGSVLTGILLSILGGILIKISSGFKKKKSSSGGGSPYPEPPEDSH